MNKHFGWLLFLSICFAVATRAAETAVVNASKVNVRGQPTLRSEVVTQLVRGDKVEVLEKIPDPDAKPNEPKMWAKIKLPENTPVWIFAPFVKEGKVSVSRLNLRAGPGENYSVVGRVEEGTEVTRIRTVESWMEIEAPEEAHAYIAASLLDMTESGKPAIAATSATTGATPAAAQAARQSARAPVESKPSQPEPSQTETVPAPPAPKSSAPTAPAPVESSSAETPPASRQPAPEDALPGATAVPTASAQAATKAPEARPQQLPSVAPAPEKVEKKAPPRRVVRRVGLVRPTRSIQAPTPFELIHPETRRTMNFLYGADIGVKVGQFRDMTVVVTGEEGVDPRWPSTPVLQIETIDTVP